MSFVPDTNEEPGNLSQEAGQNVKQMTFTRSEAECSIALVHSRTIEESPTPFLRLEASTTTGSLKTSMASLQYPTSMETLPDELLSNIFIRLLSKQLAQMRSVSKSWNVLLSQSSFIKSHLHRSIYNNDPILLVFYDYNEVFSDFESCEAIPAHSLRLKLTDFIKLPVNTQPEYTNDISIIGSVNGLICSSYGDSVIHIWNPSLSAVLTLPPYSMPSGGHDPMKIYFRFGFDPKTNDYKVVKITGLIQPRTRVMKQWLRIQIYSMRKGTWEIINERFPSHIKYIIDGDNISVDGHDGYLHWLGSTNEEVGLDTIVAFDLGSETFREMSPPNPTQDRNRSNQLGVLSGKLCVMSHLSVNHTSEVWVMSEYGVAESWVKLHVFSHFYPPRLFGFSSPDKFLIEDDCLLVLYDRIANKQEFLSGFRPENYNLHQVVEYFDSLVWVTPG